MLIIAFILLEKFKVRPRIKINVIFEVIVAFVHAETDKNSKDQSAKQTSQQYKLMMTVLFAQTVNLKI
jgi:hypothetical protein